MREDLPVLRLEESKHGRLMDCIRLFPYIMEVFHNVCSRKPLDYDIKVPEMKTLSMYIEEIFVPILLKYKAIARDESSPNELRPLVRTILTA